MNRVDIPDIQALVQPLLGQPYAENDCWDLVRHLLNQGFGLDLVRDAETAAQRVQEVWYRGECAGPAHPGAALGSGDYRQRGSLAGE